MSYNIPRNVKGEGRILYIFSYKAIIYTVVGIVVGLFFYLLFSLVGLKVVGYVFIGVFAFIGYGIATFKMPNVNFLKGAKLAAGEQIDEVINRAIKFKMNKNKYYTYTPSKQNKGTEEKEGGTLNGK